MSVGEMEMYDIFQKNLHAGLKKRINASVFVDVHEGDLYVKITKGRMEWSGILPDIFKSLVNGYSVENFVNCIVKQYRKVVLNAYFY